MLLKNFKIKKEWVDYNEHLNMAYYVLIFDLAWEVALEKFNMGGTAAEKLNRSTMVVETHTAYIKELKENDDVQVNLTYFDHDKKRLHLKCEMYEKEKKTLAATMESVSLYIDLSKRKVTEFEEDKLEIMKNFISENGPNFKSENLQLSGRLKK